MKRERRPIDCSGAHGAAGAPGEPEPAQRQGAEMGRLEAEIAALEAARRVLVAELDRVRVDLDWCYRHWQAREAELAAIQSSKMWRTWMAYLAVRRVAIKVAISPLSALRAGPAAAWRLAVRGFSALGRTAARGLGWLYLLVWSAAAWMRARFRSPWRPPRVSSSRHDAAAAGLGRRPRILIVCPYSLYPLDHGGGVRIFNLLRHLSKSCDLQILVFTRDDDIQGQREVLEPISEKVYFHRWQPAFRRDLWGLKPRGVRLFEAPEVHELIERILAREAIDVLQLEYTEMGQYGLPAFARVKVVLTEIDVAFRSLVRRQRVGMHRRYRWGRIFGDSIGDCMRQFRYELQVARSADAVHFMSEDDAVYLSRFLPAAQAKTHVVPNAVDAGHYTPPAQWTARGRHFLFLGNFQHLPNLDALDYLIERIWPVVRRSHPQAELVVAGAAAGEEVWRNHGREGITVLGAVSDSCEHYRRARALVAPLRAGSGTRLKILEAMACGTPVISTTIGAEGIDAADGQQLLIADGEHAFAEAMGRVLRDEDLCRRLGTAARALVERRYTWEQSASAAVRSYAALLEPAGTIPRRDHGSTARRAQASAGSSADVSMSASRGIPAAIGSTSSARVGAASKP